MANKPNRINNNNNKHCARHRPPKYERQRCLASKKRSKLVRKRESGLTLAVILMVVTDFCEPLFFTRVLTVLCRFQSVAFIFLFSSRQSISLLRKMRENAPRARSFVPLGWSRKTSSSRFWPASSLFHVFHKTKERGIIIIKLRIGACAGFWLGADFFGGIVKFLFHLIVVSLWR